MRRIASVTATKKVRTTVQLDLCISDQADMGFVDQRRCLQLMASLFTIQSVVGQLPQFCVDERQQLGCGPRITLFTFRSFGILVATGKPAFLCSGFDPL